MASTEGYHSDGLPARVGSAVPARPRPIDGLPLAGRQVGSAAPLEGRQQALEAGCEVTANTQPALVINDPDGWPCLHLATCWHATRPDLKGPQRETTPAEARQHPDKAEGTGAQRAPVWPRCRACKPAI